MGHLPRRDPATAGGRRGRRPRRWRVSYLPARPRVSARPAYANPPRPSLVLAPAGSGAASRLAAGPRAFGWGGGGMAFGWGIVSTGRHPDVKVAPAMSAAAGGELVAVYSRDQGRADDFARRHGARAAYSKLADLLGDSRVDGVFVCSPNALHAEHVVQAARAGKPVLCEKPMATSIADAVRMVQACRSAGVPLGVAFNLRQHPGYIRARQIVAAGALG